MRDQQQLSDDLRRLLDKQQRLLDRYQKLLREVKDQRVIKGVDQLRRNKTRHLQLTERLMEIIGD
jgi:predicted CopG family antitoxin